jgi:sugar O-acyltransferase (sialic acid O-acetyltransferase NeuD family)
MKNVVIFGVGQIAEVVHFYLTHDSEFRVSAFTVDAAYLKDTAFLGLPVVPFEEIQAQYPPSRYGFFVAVSYKDVNRFRAEKVSSAEAKGYQLISYVSSKASVWPGLKVGANTFIMEDNTVQPFARIGNDVIVWSGNHIGHHSIISDHCFIASHVVISGSVTVGEYSFIGVNATIRDNVTIGKSCVIGAGALILHDTKDFEVYSEQKTEPSKVPSNRLPHI